MEADLTPEPPSSHLQPPGPPGMDSKCRRGPNCDHECCSNPAGDGAVAPQCTHRREDAGAWVPDLASTALDLDGQVGKRAARDRREDGDVLLQSGTWEVKCLARFEPLAEPMAHPRFKRLLMSRPSAPTDNMMRRQGVTKIKEPHAKCQR